MKNLPKKGMLERCRARISKADPILGRASRPNSVGTISVLSTELPETSCACPVRGVELESITAAKNSGIRICPFIINYDLFYIYAFLSKNDLKSSAGSILAMLQNVVSTLMKIFQKGDEGTLRL
jgi:hypothetical protein